MSAKNFTTIRINKESLNKAKLAILGTDYKLGEFYAIAAAEKIERDNLRNWIETPRQIGKLPHDSKNIIGKIENGKAILIKDLTAEKAIGKPYKPDSE